MKSTPEMKHRLAWSASPPAYAGSRGHAAQPAPARPANANALAQALLDTLGHAALACDASGAILLANADGEEILKDGDGIARRDGMLHIHDRLAQKKARQVFATPPADDGLEALLIPRPSGLASYQMVVKRPFSGQSTHATRECTLVVTISDPASPPPLKHVAIARLYSLTPAECRLARDLILGATPKEIAVKTGVKISTVRTQLRTLFQKTECNRQADLLRVFCTVPGLR